MKIARSPRARRLLRRLQKWPIRKISKLQRRFSNWPGLRRDYIPFYDRLIRKEAP